MNKFLLVSSLMLLTLACGSNWIIPEPPPPGPDVVSDAGEDPDSGCPIEEDGGMNTDSGVPVDPPDAGSVPDSGTPPEDAGQPPDAGTPPEDGGTDAGTPAEDAGTPQDAGTDPDAGCPDDGGVKPPKPDEKVCICHIPKGKPGNANTLCLPAPAVEAHLKHGDYLGSCQEEE